MKPVPQMYKGIQFRSKLEACWAAFFDELGMTWDYEPQAFNVNGKRYLPDFLVHGKRAFYAEVKPVEPSPEKVVPLETMAKDGEIQVVLLVGQPRVFNLVSVFSSEGQTTEQLTACDKCTWAGLGTGLCPSCGALLVPESARIYNARFRAFKALRWNPNEGSSTHS